MAATAEAVKLLDFNPVGGTTAPLLFSWEELGYGGALPQGEQSEPAVVGLEEGMGCAERGEAPAQEAPPAAATTADAAYLQQLRQVQALSLGDGPAAAGSGGGGGAAAGCACGATAPCVDAAQQQQQQQREPHAPAAAAPAEEGGAGPATPAAPEFRIITKPVAMRPNKLAYGVPFDFVDDSEVGASGGRSSALFLLYILFAFCNGGS